MDILSAEFLSALLAIVVIDLVLAGDNAIVIALAARKLPPALQRRAVIWGSVGAVVVRSVMTLAVVWLLKVPGLLLAGGALLLWIAFKLMAPGGGHEEDSVDASTTFFGAMKTIVIADAVMGVDNVLAVAGAAHGSYLLVVLGLLISVPIVVWGSTLLLKLTERFPIIVMVGAGVLAFTGVKMMLSEPLVKPWLADADWIALVAYLVGVGGLLLIGFARQSTAKLRDAKEAHDQRVPDAQRDATEILPADTVRLSSNAGAPAMNKILVPIDGSPNSLEALRHLMRHSAVNTLEVLLVNVQPTLTRRIGRHVAGAERDAWRQERAEAATRVAREELLRHGVTHSLKVAVGDRAEAISAAALANGCQRIVVGTARKHSLTRLIENSVTARLLDQAPVPVEVVVGKTSSHWERWGLPATLGAALAAAIAAD
ncbi:MAG: YjbE family putative metal transport protein [Betaproteobacteria bacterium]|nr:YjbE family putative metal transport protein [Betaproteobacteria bacterium]